MMNRAADVDLLSAIYLAISFAFLDLSYEDQPFEWLCFLVPSGDHYQMIQVMINEIVCLLVEPIRFEVDEQRLVLFNPNR